jgi:DNA-binding transcriptional LysR family regulator
MASKRTLPDPDISRRLRLRDLLVFSSVAESGSMAKAASEMGITQPSVSEAISGLEHIYGVPLFDRSPRGVQLTPYGQALLKRSAAIFDEVAQSARDVAHLADPESGEIRIACLESFSSTVLAAIMQRFIHLYPRVTINIEHLTSRNADLNGLRARAYDLALMRLDAIAGDVETDDFVMETLFTDQLVIAAGLQNPWLRKKKVALAALVNEPWILSPPGYWHYKRVVEAFRQQGLEPPKPRILAFTVMLRMQLLAGGPHISVFSGPVMKLYGAKFGVGAIPVQFPNRPWPVVAITLKRQTQSPVVTEFIATARDVAKNFLGN